MDQPLIEVVPNFSEGRRTGVIDRLASSVTGVAGVFMLDRTSDVDHHRSVLTFAGPPDAATDAMERAVAMAIEAIDMEDHAGVHPRIGAVDVVPFVPLAGISMAETAARARAFGRRMAEQHGIPVYLYAEAAIRPERVRLADVRSGEYEGLKVAIREPGRQPDFGPRRMHPTAGAMAVGARPFLIAWNINLASSDVDLAKRIARTIRESGGGLARVQANGFWIAALGRAQVSMNLLDFRVTAIWRVWEAVAQEAGRAGVDIAESELIGLAPLEAFLDVATHVGVPESQPQLDRLSAAATAIRLRDFSADRILELRLEAARAAVR